MTGPDIPRRYEATIVVAAVTCRQCQYVLRGLRATGSCPECGCDVWTSVLTSIDEDAGKYGHLANPRAAGDGLVLVVLALLLTAFLLIAEQYLGRLERLWAGIEPVRTALRAAWQPGIPAIGVLGLIGVMLLWPRAGARWSIRSGVFPTALGMLLWLVPWWVGQTWAELTLGGVSQRTRDLADILVGTLTLVLIFRGLRNVLETIGQRSVAYRKAQGGRQGFESMIVAVLAGAVSLTVRRLGVDGIVPAAVRSTGTLVFLVCCLMLLVGLAYLVMNAWWIRREIRAPRPGLDEALREPLPDQTVIDPPETHFEVHTSGRIRLRDRGDDTVVEDDGET